MSTATLPPVVKVGLFVNTPAQVHFFRPLVDLLQARGHETLVLARYHPETRRLLEEHQVAHVRYATPAASKWGKLAQLPRDVSSARRLLKRNGVDAVTGFGVYDVLAASSLGIPSVCFTDTEAAYHGLGLRIQYAVFAPLATRILTPVWFRETLSRRQERIRAYKEVAYLHPRRFTPNGDPNGLGGLSFKEPFAFLRLSAHGALHDAGHQGLVGEPLLRLVHALEERMRVWISFEGRAPAGLERYEAPMEKRRIHDVLYHAELVLGDSGSIPVEAALLGTPSLRYTSRPSSLDMGGFRELESVGLLASFRDVDGLIAEAAHYPVAASARTERRHLARTYIESLDDPIAILADRIEAVGDRH